MTRILVVDDSPEIRCCLRAILEGAGHAVIEADTFLEGLAILRSRTVEFAIVDGCFPAQHVGNHGQTSAAPLGNQLCREALALGVRTLLLSGEQELVELERKIGHAALMKPARMAEILDEIERPKALEG